MVRRFCVFFCSVYLGAVFFGFVLGQYFALGARVLPGGSGCAWRKATVAFVQCRDFGFLNSAIEYLVWYPQYLVSLIERLIQVFETYGLSRLYLFYDVLPLIITLYLPFIYLLLYVTRDETVKSPGIEVSKHW